MDRILELEPDLAIGFSDMQADIAQALIKAGIEVWISNHRSVAGILGYVRRLGALVGVPERAERYALGLERRIDEVRAETASLAARPRVYFEEWDEPLITGIRWVSELIGIAGGEDISPSAPAAHSARIAFSRTPGRLCGAHRRSSSARGAGSDFGPSGSLPGPAGMTSRRSATASSMKSSRP